MAHSEEGSRKTEAPAPASRRVLVYKPCAVCGRAVELSDDTRVQEDPETYECQNCGARFYLDPPTP